MGVIYFSERSKFSLVTYHMKRGRCLFVWNKNLEASQKTRQKKTMHKVAEEHSVGYVTVGNWKKKRKEIK
jgi:TolB-like protein